MASGDFYGFEASDKLLKKQISTMDFTFDYMTENYGDATKTNERSVLQSEITKPTDELKEKKVVMNSQRDTEKRLGHRRVHVDGGVSYKKIHSSKIMEWIQLGIRASVEGLADKPERDVLMADFMAVESTSFAADESVLTSTSPGFVFKTYAPIAFRYFRDLFGIMSDGFVTSFCNAELIELPNPGASGSVFYLTQNDNFITKTVQNKEAVFLQKLMPGYYLNLNQNPCTLLPKFFGLFCCKCDSKNIRLVVMNNVLPSSIKIHRKYDLKGSTYKRRASKTECEKNLPTYKDLDFINDHPEGVFLDADLYKNLIKTIQRDCRVLESFQIIDYSLLVGVHYVDETKREEQQKINKAEGTDKEEETNDKIEGDGDINNCKKDDSFKVEETSGGSKIKASFLLNTRKRGTNSKGGKDFGFEGIPARTAKGENILLFLGIIDILQSYRLKKRIEHVWKSILHDSESVSVHNPAFYAKRFQDFMTNTVFKTISSPKNNKRKSWSRLKSAEN